MIAFPKTPLGNSGVNLKFSLPDYFLLWIKYISYSFSTKLETNYESLRNNHHPPTSTPNGPGSGDPQSEEQQQAKESIKSEAETIQNSTIKPIHNYPDYYQVWITE